MSDFAEGLLGLDSTGTADVNNLLSLFLSAGSADAAVATAGTALFPPPEISSCDLVFGFVDFSDGGCSLDLETAFSLGACLLLVSEGCLGWLFGSVCSFGFTSWVFFS